VPGGIDTPIAAGTGCLNAWIDLSESCRDAIMPHALNYNVVKTPKSNKSQSFKGSEVRGIEIDFAFIFYTKPQFQSKPLENNTSD
jgi:hypothetical protein